MACLLVLGCGGAAPEAAAPTAEASEKPAEPKLAEEPTVPSGPTEPYAKVLAVQPHTDDPADRRVHLEFFNPTKKQCTFSSYTLTWPGGSKRMPLDDVTIPSGNSRQRYLNVHPSDGDLESLTADGASVELELNCK